MSIKPTAIDCFAGAGGISLGLKDAGYNVVAAFDNNSAAAKSYEANLGAHIAVEDARSLTGKQLLQIAGLQRGQVDLVAGGPPCQGFSIQRRGEANDSRNGLILEFLRLVREISPKAFLMENVSALAGPKNRAMLALFCKSAEEQGYSVQWKVVNAADYGTPQARKRLLVIGERYETATDVFALPSPSQIRTVRDAIGALPEPGSYETTGFHNHQADNISDLNRLRISYVPPGGGREDIPAELQLACHAVSVEKAGHRGVYGRLWWDRPATTITTKCNSFTRGRFAHPEQNRNITMREAARLQGFPDSFIFHGGKVDVAHQVGNAVPPPLIQAIATNLKERILQSQASARTEIRIGSLEESSKLDTTIEQHSIAVAGQSTRDSSAMAASLT